MSDQSVSGNKTTEALPGHVEADELHRVRILDGVASVLETVEAGRLPIDMLLWCPSCHTQHVDEPDERTPDWQNPPHKSHLCHSCGAIWRPADVPTNGVRAIQTRGKADTWPA